MISKTIDSLRYDVEKHLANDLPFVLYSSFNSNCISALFQTNNSTYTSTNFSESGFVFAPFDLSQNTYLIPFENSDLFHVEISPSEIKNFTYESQQDQKLDHLQMVSDAIDYIKNSPLQKVVLARTATLNCSDIDVYSIFLNIINAYSEAFVYCWFHPKTGIWLGASPESLLSINNNQLKTMALAGTQTYEGTTDVVWDVKNLEEQKYVTRHLKQVLSSELTNLSVTKPKTIRAGQLVHLQSILTGTLKESEANLKRLVHQIHPTPAVCGTPVDLAKRYVFNNESMDREFYSGFLGPINTMSPSKSKETHLVVNLRCMKITERSVTLYAGGGITSKSIPEQEWLETEAKIKTLKSIF